MKPVEELEDFRSETPQAHYRFADGILSIELKPELIIDELTARRIEHFRKEMTGTHEVPVLMVIPGDHLLLDKQAFQYFGSQEAMKACMAKALVIQAPLRVLLVNFSLSFYKQSRPFRLFTNRGDAKMWLFGHLQIDRISE